METWTVSQRMHFLSLAILNTGGNQPITVIRENVTKEKGPVNHSLQKDKATTFCKNILNYKYDIVGVVTVVQP